MAKRPCLPEKTMQQTPVASGANVLGPAAVFPMNTLVRSAIDINSIDSGLSDGYHERPSIARTTINYHCVGTATNLQTYHIGAQSPPCEEGLMKLPHAGERAAQRQSARLEWTLYVLSSDREVRHRSERHAVFVPKRTCSQKLPHEGELVWH